MMTGYECIDKASLFITDHFKAQPKGEIHEQV